MIRPSPTSTIRFVPTFSTSRAESGATIIIVTAHGTSLTPASSGL